MTSVPEASDGVCQNRDGPSLPYDADYSELNLLVLAAAGTRGTAAGCQDTCNRGKNRGKSHDSYEELHFCDWKVVLAWER